MSSPFHTKGKEREIVPDIQQSLEAPQQPNNRPGNQLLRDIFPKIESDYTTTEKQEILYHYAQELQRKAEETYPEVIAKARKDEIPIYYKWYGPKYELTQLFAIHDTENDIVLIGPKEGPLLRKAVGTAIPISIQKALKYIKSGKSVEYSIYNIAGPLHKQEEMYDGKRGLPGYYFTDNYTWLLEEYGGTPQDIVALHKPSNLPQTRGPWTSLGNIAQTRRQREQNSSNGEITFQL
jgi:hypothetical protein